MNVALFFQREMLHHRGEKERGAIVATAKLYFPVGSLEIYDRRKLLAGNARANGVISDPIDSVNRNALRNFHLSNEV